jgi:hypothetical protein
VSFGWTGAPPGPTGDTGTGARARRPHRPGLTELLLHLRAWELVERLLPARRG